MGKGIKSKELAIIERKPDDIWWWRCNGEIIKTCNNKKSLSLWLRLHMKKCYDCRNSGSTCNDLFISENGRVNESGNLILTKQLNL